MRNIQQLVINHLDIWTASDTERKATRGRSAANTVSVFGIKKLRQLILQLAVRGKLVKQDRNEEPAIELLRRIHEEKIKLIAEGKVKKEKPLLPISNKEKLFNIPSGWEWVRLVDIIKISSGDGLTSDQMNKSGNIPVFGGNGITGYHNLPNVTKRTLVIGRVGYYCGSIHITPNPSWVTDNAFITEFSEDNISLEFLYYLLQITNLKEHDSATAQPVISGKKIYPIVVALPPNAEQLRIVAKVKELMALCDQLETEHNNAVESHEKLVSHLLSTLTQSQSPEDFNENWQRIAAHFDILFTTEFSIDSLKKSLLQLAIRGKIVPQDTNNEPVSSLLKRIDAEKTKLIAEGKIKKFKFLPPLRDEEKIFDLPQGWAWCRLQDITKLITDGKHGDCSDLTDSGYYFLSAKNIQNGRLLYENARQIVPKEFQEVHQRTALEPGDICMVNTGATVGKMAVAPDNAFTSRTTFQKSVAVIKIIQPHIDRNYITYFLTAEAPNLLKKSGGSAINNLLLGDLKMLPVPLPPTREQTAIVKKIDELLILCDQLKTNITESNLVQKKLANVIIDRCV